MLLRRNIPKTRAFGLLRTGNPHTSCSNRFSLSRALGWFGSFSCGGAHLFIPDDQFKNQNQTTLRKYVTSLRDVEDGDGGAGACEVLG